MKFEKENHDKTQKITIYLDETGFGWVTVYNDEYGTTYDINHFDPLDTILLFFCIIMIFISILAIFLAILAIFL